MFKAPYYDPRNTYSLVSYMDHDAQSLIALFIHKHPQLNVRLNDVHVVERQEYFFHLFHQFAKSYIHLSLDDSIYFGNTSKEKAGSANITGGGGAKSRSGAKFLKDRYRIQNDNQQSRITYFERKFKCCISGERDERRFVGHAHLWNKLGVESVRESILKEYESQIACAYDDATLQTPFPDKLNPYFVPLEIRNKVYQQWRNRTRASQTPLLPKKNMHGYVEEEEEDGCEETKSPTPNMVDKVAIAMAEINAMIDDEDW